MPQKSRGPASVPGEDLWCSQQGWTLGSGNWRLTAEWTTFKDGSEFPGADIQMMAVSWKEIYPLPQGSNDGSLIHTGWWFGTWLVFSHILGIIIPIDYFFRGVQTTNQKILYSIFRETRDRWCFETEVYPQWPRAQGSHDSPLDRQSLRKRPSFSIAFWKARTSAMEILVTTEIHQDSTHFHGNAFIGCIYTDTIGVYDCLWMYI